MPKPIRFIATALCAALLASPALAQPAAEPPTDVVKNSGMDAELFYQVLLGELNARANEPGTAYSLILDAARKGPDSALFERAVDIALQARNGESALLAARAWKQAFPGSREANRYVLQINIALNRLTDATEALKSDIALTEPARRSQAIAAMPRHFSRASDKKQAAVVVEQALSDYLNQPATGAAAWTTVGRLRVAAGDTRGALEAARKGSAMDTSAEGPALLALDLMEPRQPQAEPLVRQYLASGKATVEIRMGYARALLDAQRYTEATTQLRAITAARPDFAEAWLVLGTLQVQDSQYGPAEAALKKYIDLTTSKTPTESSEEESSRGLAQAYLSLAQIAEKQGNFASAESWLGKIDNAKDLLSAQNRRASILARQGRMDEARKLLQALPERNPADVRMKLFAEVQLLRDHKQYQAAYDLLSEAGTQSPKDTDLLYDLSMLAEKLGNLAEMERLLRQVIEVRPDYHHAYNALGYSLAERNIRLPEARDLIRKALEFAPGDPFISDSLGWTEFRMGNKTEAARILDAAYKAKPDAEIAAHLGEVLWSMGQKEKATSIWREGLLLNAENDTLQETLKRLRVKP